MITDNLRESNNVEDFRGGGNRPRFGMKHGILGTIVMAVVVYFLGGNPLSVLHITNTTIQQPAEQAELTVHQKEMTVFVSKILASTEDVWGKLFKSIGTAYRQPKLVLFSGEISSACGYAQAATGPFYCPGDEKVYLDLDFLESLQKQLGAEGDFAVAYIIAHEVGHHVQKLLGIMDSMDQLRASGTSQKKINEANVRLELQADFLAGVWINHGQEMQTFLEKGDLEEALNAATAVGDDKIQMETQGRVMPDSFTHGTSAQRKHWLDKGIETGDINQGGTFNSLE